MKNTTLEISLNKDIEDGQIYIKNKINFSNSITLFTISKKEPTKVSEKTKMFEGGDRV